MLMPSVENIHVSSQLIWFIYNVKVMFKVVPRTRIGLMISPLIRNKLGMLTDAFTEEFVSDDDDADDASTWSEDIFMMSVNQTILNPRGKVLKLHSELFYVKYYFEVYFTLFPLLFPLE